MSNSRAAHLVALMAYLAAAFLPCPPARIPPPDSEPVPIHAAAPHSAHAPAPHAASPSAHEHGRAEASESTAHASRGKREVGRILRAVCLCGCSETRSTVGGAAARLGPVVPGSESTPLPETDDRATSPAPSPLFVQHVDDIDPVPV
ncbi:MAG: hypothetical protein ACX98W_04635 [bacterium]